MGLCDIWVRKFSQEEVEFVLVRWIVEVVEEVSRDGLLAVVELSGVGDLAGSCEFDLECSGAGIQHADAVGILSPVVSEHYFKVSWELLKSHAVGLQDAACLFLDENLQRGAESGGCFWR